MNHRCAVEIERIGVEPALESREELRRAGLAEQSGCRLRPPRRPACRARPIEGSTPIRCPTPCAKMPNRGGSCRRTITLGVARPLVIDVHPLRGPADLAHEIDRQVPERRVAQHANAENIPGDRKPLRPVAQMARDMMEESRDFGAADPIGRRQLEDVVPLIGIERRGTRCRAPPGSPGPSSCGRRRSRRRRSRRQNACPRSSAGRRWPAPRPTDGSRSARGTAETPAATRGAAAQRPAEVTESARHAATTNWSFKEFEDVRI